MEKQLSLIKFFKETRQQTESICQPLEPEDYLSQPTENVSPPKWHLGHTTWFYEALILKVFHKNYKVFDEDYFFLFNSYYNTLGDRTNRFERGNQTRPVLKKIYEYRSYVDYELVKFLENNSSEVEKIYSILELGINHEKQHQELLITDIKYILYQNKVLPSYQSFKNNIFQANKPLNNEMIKVDEGIYQIGYNGPDFHFDNEEGEHKVYLEAFKFAKHTVTNEAYLEFILNDGYKDFRHWLSDGWTWINENNIESPLFWKNIDGKWFYYTLGGLREIDLHAPVCHISFYEADAYATWAGKRLLTEFEWEVAAKKFANNKTDSNCLEKNILSPIPAHKSVNQLLGNVWEWTNSAYLAYPYFKIAEGALAEYNGKFMANQMVLRGGSCATPLSQVRIHYRNFFYLHERWQFTGIRLAEYS
ncbi:MAG: ergothioneine biosynthesis protein EgtB [Chlorobi bacterium]|nr:ergothioneine biosynthesis protein EgtB [Chlorobiota bacterium]